MQKFVSYRRVSTARQGQSGLGLEAQTAAVEKYVSGCGGSVIADYTENESGRRCDRPELLKAIAHARRSQATLLIAKLDRLGRSAAFLLQLLDSGVEIVAADNPLVNRFTMQILACVAENEAKAISQRTKDALAAAKARGVLLGSARPGHWAGKERLRSDILARARPMAQKAIQADKWKAYSDLIPIVHAEREAGATLREIAEKLNAAGHTTRQNKAWGQMQVKRVLEMVA